MSDDVNILAVDDVPQNLVALEAVLARPGRRLLTAAGADEALDWLLREDVALALIDVQMPHTDGFELAELIRGSERTRHIPIIFVTAANRDPQRTFRGYEAGAVDFLHKPLNPAILRNKVDVFVELHLQKRRLARELGEVEEALRINEMFAAVLGHDLRNPLAAIVNYATVLTRMEAAGPTVTGAAQRILSSAQRMTRLINQLLDVVRIRAGRFELSLADVDFAELCRAVCDEIRSGRADARVQLDVRGDARCACDADRMSQVMSNLVGNAMQHGEPGHPVVVTVDGSAPESIRASVANRGHIDAALLPHLFEPFHGNHDRVANPGGLGLGLHIVERFVAAHGGTVTVRSDADSGTVFVIVLPRRARAASPQADAAR
jgi:signal transduction histidine kinase